jgi:magnesium transporter
MSDELLDLAPDKYNAPEVAAQMSEIGPAEGAAVLEFLPVTIAAQTVERLKPATAAEIFSRMEDSRAVELISAMAPEPAAALLAAMAPDDRVDLMELLPKKLHEELIAKFSVAQAEQTRDLEKYLPDTAGGIMTPEVTALPNNITVGEAVSRLRDLHEERQKLFYVYVVDDQRRLVGVLSMRDLILARPERPVTEIMIPNVRSVPDTMDQEEVAELMRSARYLALPVVDKDQRLLGLVTFDDVADVIEEEATEDVQRMFGAGAEERLSSPWQFSFSKRIWWLQVNLGTAFLAGAVVSLFSPTIAKFAVLAIYMPVISGMGSNAAAQAMSVSIRGITSGRTDRKLLRHVLAREAIVGMLSGAFIGITTAAIALILQLNHGPALGLVVGLSILITQTLACVSGAAVPFAMSRLGFDPAQSATIFVTTITDVTGFASLLGLATLFKGWMH